MMNTMMKMKIISAEYYGEDEIVLNKGSKVHLNKRGDYPPKFHLKILEVPYSSLDQSYDIDELAIHHNSNRIIFMHRDFNESNLCLAQPRDKVRRPDTIKYHN